MENIKINETGVNNSNTLPTGEIEAKLDLSGKIILKEEIFNNLLDQNKLLEIPHGDSILSDSNKNLKIETYELDIIFRRKFSKRLCFLNGLIINRENDSDKDIKQENTNNDNKNNNKVLEMKIENPEIIQRAKIGDKVEVKGFYKFDEVKKRHCFICIDLQIKSKCPKDFDIFGKRLKTSALKTDSEKTLCKFFRKSQTCTLQNCIFRHYLLENEEQKLKKSNEYKLKMYSESHEGDTVDDKDKKSKSTRHRLFAEFLVKAYGFEYLKSGPIIDVAGGKGLVSFYLALLYDLECVIVDPRGVTMHKKYIKVLSKQNKFIEERRIIFDENFDAEMIKKSSLIIGMHPDEATDYIIFTAMKNNKKFAVVPCCVFPKIFTNRFLANGDFVNDYPKYVKFIQEKVPNHKTDFLEIIGRNKIIYID